MKKSIVVFILLSLNIFVCGQTSTKYQIDCDSVFENSENTHKPIKNGSFMAAIDLSSPSNWKNKDTLNLSPFTLNNLQNNMSIVVFSLPENENKKDGEIIFSSLIYFEDNSEYGENIDSNYCAEFNIKKDILILKEKNWWSKAKKFKYEIRWIGQNCCQWIRLNPSKKLKHPRTIEEKIK